MIQSTDIMIAIKYVW